MHSWRWFALAAMLVLQSFQYGAAWALDPAGALVLYNAASAEGQQIAQHYKSVYPEVRLLGLNGLGTSESISAADYLSLVRPQVLTALSPDIDLIVTTKGLPLRIHVDEPNPGTYIDPSGVTRSVLRWEPYSSLESELAAIDRISTTQMMGDQSFLYVDNASRNPYYAASNSFSHEAYGTRLTARLDGYSVSDVISAIDRAQEAYVGPLGNPNGPLHFVVDNDPSRPYDATLVRLVDNVLAPAGMPHVYDNTAAFVSDAPGEVLGYSSHGKHQASAPAGYLLNGLEFSLADGAVFTSLESYNAYSFNVGGYTGPQGQLAEWLQIGGTAGVGYVEEPIASWVSVANEDLLFQGLLNGLTFAEAAWSANFQLSFVNTVVGDPLMQWRVLGHGDINRDGLTDLADLAIMGAYWGATTTPGGDGWMIGDLNCDGVVDLADLAILGSYWGDAAPWASRGLNTGGFEHAQLGLAIQPYLARIPEPSSWVLLILGLTSLAAWRCVLRRLFKR